MPKFHFTVNQHKVKSSKSWKLVNLLQRTRVFIFPPGSWRTNFLKKILLFFALPVSYLYKKIPVSIKQKTPLFMQKSMNRLITFSPDKKKQNGFIHIFKKGIPFLLRLKGVIIFGGYPYPEYEKDGYYQRIKAIDSLLNSHWRIYVDANLPRRGEGNWYDRPNAKTLVLFLNYNKKKINIAYFSMFISIIRCRSVYFHSIFPLRDFEFVLKMPLVKKIVDLHGVVPEELSYNGYSDRSKMYEAVEKIAAEKADYLITVSDAMKKHFIEKYSDLLHGQFITLPILPTIPDSKHKKSSEDKKCKVVYAGGLQKWQQVPKMISVVGNTVGSCDYYFFVPNPEKLKAILSEQGLSKHPSIVVESRSHDELLEIYLSFDYGFIFREKIVINQVACPTKLVEYLATGIIPIMDAEKIGDFVALGMQYVQLQDFLTGRLPNDNLRANIIENNFVVYEKLKEQYSSGKRVLCQVLQSNKQEIG